jgi:hypothetical protein
LISKIKTDFGLAKLLKFNTFGGFRFEINKSLEELQPYFQTFDRTLISTYDYKRGWLSPRGWGIKNSMFWADVLARLNLPKNRIMLGI